MMRAAALLLALLCAWPALAQSPAPFLWRIGGTGVSHYLLGSVHLLPASAHPLPAALDRAYRDAEILIFESDLAALTTPELQQRLVAMALSDRPEGLAGELPPAIYARIGRQAGELGLPAQVCDRFQAWFCALTLEIAGFMQAGFAAEYGIDQHFHAQATRDAKTIAWLESVQDHVDLFTQMPAALGPSFLEATLDALADPDGSPAALVRDWRDGDTAALAARVDALRAGHPQAYARLIGDRNRTWLAPLDRQFRQRRPVLAIVGAAHLLGPDGLLRQLRDRGFTVEAVEAAP